MCHPFVSSVVCVCGHVSYLHAVTTDTEPQKGSVTEADNCFCGRVVYTRSETANLAKFEPKYKYNNCTRDV